MGLLRSGSVKGRPCKSLWIIYQCAMVNIQRILDYWFGGIDDKTVLGPDSEIVQRWFKGNEQTDEEIRQLFSSDLIKARKGKYEQWQDTAEGMLALIILLDQFSRNIYRDSVKAYDTDLKALECCLLSIKSQFDRKLQFIQRQFMYMPLMHSENLKVQEKSLVIFEKLANEVNESGDANAGYFDYVYEFAKRHYDIIKRFERFPQRNKILKRRSTSTEIEFLNDPDNLF
jgi:uncharacterized protein (DUF924 family)